MNEDRIKAVVADVMSDLFNEAMKKGYDRIDSRFDHTGTELTDLQLTSQILAKIVDHAKLEARVLDLEDRLKKS